MKEKMAVDNTRKPHNFTVHQEGPQMMCSLNGYAFENTKALIIILEKQTRHGKWFSRLSEMVSVFTNRINHIAPGIVKTRTKQGKQNPDSIEWWLCKAAERLHTHSLVGLKKNKPTLGGLLDVSTDFDVPIIHASI